MIDFVNVATDRLGWLWLIILLWNSMDLLELSKHVRRQTHNVEGFSSFLPMKWQYAMLYFQVHTKESGSGAQGLPVNSNHHVLAELFEVAKGLVSSHPSNWRQLVPVYWVCLEKGHNYPLDGNGKIGKLCLNIKILEEPIFKQTGKLPGMEHENWWISIEPVDSAKLLDVPTWGIKETAHGHTLVSSITMWKHDWTGVKSWLKIHTHKRMGKWYSLYLRNQPFMRSLHFFEPHSRWVFSF